MQSPLNHQHNSLPSSINIDHQIPLPNPDQKTHPHVSTPRNISKNENNPTPKILPQETLNEKIPKPTLPSLFSPPILPRRFLARYSLSKRPLQPLKLFAENSIAPERVHPPCTCHYFALMHFLGSPQAHSSSRVSRSISSIYKAAGGGKIDVVVDNARGLLHEGSSFSLFFSIPSTPDFSSAKYVSLSPGTIVSAGGCNAVAAPPWTPWRMGQADMVVNNGEIMDIVDSSR